MSDANWSMKGPEYGNCNCDWGCPCQFNAMPTDGTCRAVCAVHVEEGHFGDTSLDGLNWAITYNWPGAVHEGNGTMQAFIDERADGDQRAALAEILYGRSTEEGVHFLQIFASTMTTMLDPVFAPIEFEFDMEARKAQVKIGDVVESVGTPIPNPFTGEPHRVKIVLPNGMEHAEAEYGSGNTTASGEVKLDLKDSHAAFARIHVNQSGVVR